MPRGIVKGQTAALFQRPYPPQSFDGLITSPRFERATDVEEWIREAYLDEGGPLFNADHRHLERAFIGVLWTNVTNRRRGASVAATAEMPQPPTGNAWQKARWEAQMLQWFGSLPDFLITIDAGIANYASDLAFCGLVDHELYHLGQAKDEFGCPRFRKKEGTPIFTMVGHDVEEFVGVVRRYGAHGLLNPQVAALVEAAGKKPRVQSEQIELACGTCGSGMR